MSEGGSKVQTEISIEETNRIRISLGLKPLKIDEPKRTTPVTTPTTTTSNTSTTDDVKDTINQLKKKRESKLIGKSIAEQLLENGEDDDEDDISNWVNKSRDNEKKKLEERKKSLRITNKKNIGNEHYSQKNLKGLKVGNDLKNFEEDSETILTLQDTNVLDEDGEDVLVNVNIAERERREKQVQDSKKKSKYDKFDEYGNSKYSLLNQDDDTINSNNKVGFSLGDNGIIQTSDSLKEQAKKNLDYLASYDMDTTTSSSILSSFYTQEEMEKFKSRSAQKKSTGSTDKKKKKIRKKNKDEDSDILASLDATTSSDLGSRKTRVTEKEKRDQETILKREENYQRALDKASEISKLTYSADIFEEAEDEDFYKSLSSSKKSNIISNKNIVDIVNKNKQQQQKQKQQEEQVEGDGTEDLEEITINPTSEFVRSLNPEGIISNYKSNLTTTTTQSKIDIDEDEEMNDIQVNNNNNNNTNNNKNNNNNNNKEEDESDESDESDSDSNNKSIKSLTDEPLLASSMSATLKLLAQKGDLQPQLPTSGTKKRSINYDDSESTIIELKDEFGRVLDRKEAFVKMSQIFHGKKSHKKKQEKRKKAYEEELKRMKMDSSDTPLGMVKSFQSFQEKTSSPYLVLSNSNNSNNNDTTNNLIFLNSLYKNNATTTTTTTTANNKTNKKK